MYEKPLIKKIAIPCVYPVTLGYGKGRSYLLDVVGGINDEDHQ